MVQEDFYKILRKKIHVLILEIYSETDNFPKSELYGTINQLRRASVSIMLNFVEGFARMRPKVKLNFFEISYGSAKESQYLIFLASEKKWINKNKSDKLLKKIDEIAKMLWSITNGLRKKEKDSE